MKMKCFMNFLYFLKLFAGSINGFLFLKFFGYLRSLINFDILKVIHVKSNYFQKKFP